MLSLKLIHILLVVVAKAKRPASLSITDKKSGPVKRSKPSDTSLSRSHATVAQKVEVLDWYHANGKNQSKTAKYFNLKWPELDVKQPKVWDWIKKEAAIRELYLKNPAVASTTRRVNLIKHEEVDEALSLWVCQALEDKITVTGEVLQEKWWRFANTLHIPEDEWPGLSEGWLSRFKEQNRLKERKRHGEAGSQSVATADAERKRVQEICLLYATCNIYNLDETGLFWG